MPSLDQVTEEINKEISDIQNKLSGLTEEGKQKIKIKLLQQVEKLYVLIIELSMKNKFQGLESWDPNEFNNRKPQGGKKSKKRRRKNKKKTTLKR